jgi:hypothetical protein
MGVESKILSELKKLEQQILSEDISQIARSTREWGGADVVIASSMTEGIRQWVDDQPLVISLQKTASRRRAVVTQYSKELSWLFERLKHIFSEKIDYVSKYDFYGLLAQSAIDYMENNEDNQNVKGLLMHVLNTAKGWLE